MHAHGRVVFFLILCGVIFCVHHSYLFARFGVLGAARIQADVGCAVGGQVRGVQCAAAARAGAALQPVRACEGRASGTKYIILNLGREREKNEREERHNRLYERKLCVVSQRMTGRDRVANDERRATSEDRRTTNDDRRGSGD